jgi:hypothetical protein
VIQVVTAVIGLFRAIFGGGKRARTAPIIKQVTHRRQGQITNRTVWTQAGIQAGVGAVNALIQSQAEGRDKEKIKRDFYRIYGRRLARCIWKVFGTDSNKLHHQNIKNAPDIDSRFSIGNLVDNYGAPDAGRGDNGTAIIAKEVFEGGHIKAVYGTYAHELGNILDIKLNPSGANGRTIGRTYGDHSGRVRDTDTGSAIERCIFGGLVSASGDIYDTGR